MGVGIDCSAGRGSQIYGLGAQSFWIDELASVALSKEGVFQILRNHLETNPPAYYAILHVVQEYLGSSEWVLRLPSAIAGVLAVPCIYLLGKRLYSDQEALLAALFRQSLGARFIIVKKPGRILFCFCFLY